MSPPDHRARTPLTRADLPAQLTPETLRGLSFTTLRRLADHRNGVLDAEEQRQFDAVLPEVLRGIATRVDEAEQRSPRGGPVPRDETLRRSYDRAQRRLADQARRARAEVSEFTPPEPAPPETGPEPTTPPPDGPTTTTPPPPTSDDSPTTLEQEVDQTSDTLAMLEKIASLEERQLEHQESQLLTETRGVFFAFVVSVSVIIAGVAPLVEAESHERLLIVIWTFVVTGLAGLVYALVRRFQGRD